MPFAPDGTSYVKREVRTVWLEEGKGQTPNQPLARWGTGAVMQVGARCARNPGSACQPATPREGFPGIREPSLSHCLHGGELSFPSVNHSPP